MSDEITPVLELPMQAMLDLLAELDSPVCPIARDRGVIASFADRALLLPDRPRWQAAVVGRGLSHPSDRYAHGLLAAASELEYASCI